MKNKNMKFFMIFALFAMMSDVVFAGGLANVTTAVSNTVTDFQTIAKILVVLALTWVGFMLMFKNAGISDIWHVVIGALVIGAAGKFGPLLLA